MNKVEKPQSNIKQNKVNVSIFKKIIYCIVYNIGLY